MQINLHNSEKSSTFARRMKMLIIILSVMSWVVESKSSVSGSGDIPTGVSASYSCSYQKGTVRANDEATLILTGMGGLKVQEIKVYIKSNKSAGAGQFVVYADEKVKGRKSGTMEEWFGSYDNANYHGLTVWKGEYAAEETWSVTLSGTTSSLYIEKYDISYEPAPIYTVTLMKGNEYLGARSESAANAGVVLPILRDTNDWHFAGWSEEVFVEKTEMPEMIAGGSVYYPKDNVTLWTVYSNSSSAEEYATELNDGEYLYVNVNNGLALASVPESGMMGNAWADKGNTDLYYSFAFTPSKDTAYVTHTNTGTPIGYNNQAQMAIKASPWGVVHNNEETTLFATIKGKTYVLWLNILGKDQSSYYAGLMAASTSGSSPLRLLKAGGEQEATYTCYPEFGLGIELTNEGVKELTNEWRIPFGDYELIIKDGKKSLKLKE